MLITRNISYSLSHKNILSGISLTFEKGTSTAILGLNGAGKTTLLKVLSGYLTPSTGQVQLGESDIAKLSSQKIAQHMAFVPQDFPTDFPFTVFDFVMMGRYAWQNSLFPGKQDYDVVENVLQRLNLLSFQNRVISNLSGGEKQRVLFARALAQESPILLLDEPLNHLDIKNKISFLKILKEENRKNQKTILAVMHDLHFVKTHFTHVLLLKNGTSLHFGKTENVLTRNYLEEAFDVDFTDENLMVS